MPHLYRIVIDRSNASVPKRSVERTVTVLLRCLPSKTVALLNMGILQPDGDIRPAQNLGGGGLDRHTDFP